MKEASNVSACVVLYRSGESVLDTVRCLEESTEKPEIFVVDNYCLDGVGAKLAQTWPDVQLAIMWYCPCCTAAITCSATRT